MVTCTAVRELGYDGWRWARDKALLAGDNDEKSDLLAGMACTTDSFLLAK